MGLRRLAREPFLHFLLIGVALFVLFDRTEQDGGADRRIVVAQPEGLTDPHPGFELRFPRTVEASSPDPPIVVAVATS